MLLEQSRWEVYPRGAVFKKVLHERLNPEHAPKGHSSIREHHGCTFSVYGLAQIFENLFWQIGASIWSCLAHTVKRVDSALTGMCISNRKVLGGKREQAL